MLHRKHSPKPIPVGRQEFGIAKLGARRYDLRDPYHLAVSLPWVGFAAAMLLCWLLLNLLFAALYGLRPGAILNARPGSFADDFFFSVETLATVGYGVATVGYGVMAPASPYGHVISSTEIVTGMAFTAIFTGLVFVRFSRPKASVTAAAAAVVSLHNGQPTLMLRIVNARVTIMSNATARLFVLLEEDSAEGHSLRRIHELRLLQSHLPMFVMPWTLMHVIDEASPLSDHNAETLLNSGARLFLSIEARDHALSTMVEDLKDYPADRIRFGMRFADMIAHDTGGPWTADLSRISELEIDPAFAPAPEPTTLNPTTC